MASFFNLTLDTIAPSGVSIIINNGATYSTKSAVSVKIATSDADTTGYQMKIWGDITAASTESAATWQTFSTSKSLTLTTGDGLKTIHCKVRDDVGNESAEVSDTITLNTNVPVVTITGPDKSKISKVSGFDTSVLSFVSDTDFEEYKVCVVTNSNSAQSSGVVIPTTGGSENTSGSAGGYKKNTAISVTIKGADLESASSGDGVKIVKVFVKNIAGTWSVA